MNSNSPLYFPIFAWAKQNQTPQKSGESKSSLAQNTINNSQHGNIKSLTITILIGRSSLNKDKPSTKKVVNKTNNQRTIFGKDLEAQNNMVAAVNAYKSTNLLPNGLKPTLRNCAAFFSISKSTLNTRISGKISLESLVVPGRPPVFSHQELKEIIDHLLVMAELGYGYSEIQAMNLFRYLACVLKKDIPRFKASHGFMAYLFVQFPELSRRKTLSFDKQRTSLTKDILDRFFIVLGKTYDICKQLSGQNIHPKNIWSMDEVGFALSDAGGYRVLARKGSRNVKVLAPSDRQHISVVFRTNALGFCLEPCFILKSSNQVSSFLDNCKIAGFFSPLVIGSDKAYMTYSCFDIWTKYFTQDAKFSSKNYSVLIYDGHNTHIMHLEALKHLLQNKTYAVCIPAHSSHLFNIGDVTVFAKLKSALKRNQTEYLREKNRDYTLKDFPFIFKKTWDSMINQGSIISGKFLIQVFIKLC